MNFELTGNLIVKDDEQSISASFKKREFVVEVMNERNSDWNDYIKFQLTQDRCAQLDPFSLGEPVKVSFNIRGRKWEKDGKVNYFSNLEAWRLEKVQASAGPDTPPPPFAESEVPPAGANEDLPF
ncbi:DUF3127 domain-containing protein [Plebeiibacterium marinum]|uniref:DUF3127 domain-containing protein n=1 Tax=Plebeiibacterium marinum TaxID=2992111 RepID=A0AAE3MF83_9BACT|nr:DUF3127 domain-containing protein [Plebeiobacterium marinum]MCW3806666.1 DUF3127 domain-containing protein [Plebeiobacterium marinum]